MSGAVKNTEYSKVFIRLELGAELADKPTLLGEALKWSLIKIGYQKKYIEPVESVAIEKSPNPGHVIAVIWFYVSEQDSNVEQDFTALKQEVAARISEAVKSRKE